MREAALRISPQLAEDWMFPFFLVVVIILVLVNRDANFIRNLFRALFSRRYFKMEDRREGSSWMHGLLLFAFVLVGGFVMTFFVLNYYPLDISWSKFEVFALSCGVVFLLFGLRWLVTSMIGLAIGGGDQILTDYNKFLSISAKSASIAAFLPMLCAAYMPLQMAHYWVIAGLIILVLFAVVSVIQGIFGALQSGVPFFYIFFYLCTFEFLPLAVFGKILVHSVNNFEVIA
ncbi:MAG: DUF4271 domain-containing protein [Bacteroidota bacterium]|jgi:hypothetical protein